MKNLRNICMAVLCAASFYRAGAQTEVKYYTSMGSFNIVLTDTLTPRTVDSFIARVSQKFYDGLIFHRVIDNFMIQGGDPLGTGFGGPGYTIPDEFSPTLKNVPGALAMANAGPNTNGSQFFINLVTNSSLDNHYTVFGKVTANFTVVQSIGHVPTDANDRPVTNVVMDSIRIVHLYNPAAVGNIANEVTASIYPNPAREVFNISLPDMPTRVEIRNVAGATVYRTEARGKVSIDLGNQPAGLYYVSTANANGVGESRLVLQ